MIFEFAQDPNQRMNFGVKNTGLLYICCNLILLDAVQIYYRIFGLVVVDKIINTHFVDVLGYFGV